MIGVVNVVGMVNVVGKVDLECLNFVDLTVFVSLIHINVQSRNNKFFSFEKTYQLSKLSQNLTNLSPVPACQSKSTSPTASMQTLPNNYAFYIYLHYKYSQFQQNLNIQTKSVNCIPLKHIYRFITYKSEILNQILSLIK